MTDNMQLARGRLALYAGFWLAMMSKMEWKPGQPQGGVAMVNGRTVTYNLENLNARPLGDVVYIALHEVGHPMLCHLTRRFNRDPKIYGIAIDCVLNKLLDKIATETPELGMTTPPDAIHGPDFGIPDEEVTTVEDVYDKLFKKAKKGGMALPQFDEHGEPKNEDGTDPTPEQKEAHEKEWKMVVQRAAIMAKQMGKLPGFLEQFITDMLQPKVDWRTHLRNAVSRIAKDESSYRRFNRRHISRRIYLPGMYSERIRAVGYGQDTSGSVSTPECVQGKAEMESIFEDMKPETLYYLQCDTRMQHIDVLTPDDMPLPGIKVYGRGGTNMHDLFKWACEHEQEIDFFICQTDGEIPDLDPKVVPNVPVIWLITTPATLPPGCQFGTHIHIEV